MRHIFTWMSAVVVPFIYAGSNDAFDESDKSCQRTNETKMFSHRKHSISKKAHCSVVASHLKSGVGFEGGIYCIFNISVGLVPTKKAPALLS